MCWLIQYGYTASPEWDSCKLVVRSRGTKGDPIKIGNVDRTPRETLEERLEETPNNARCFAQGWSLICWPILESLMGTTYGTKELGLCSNGDACQAGAWGLYIGFCIGYILNLVWPYLDKIKSDPAGKKYSGIQYTYTTVLVRLLILVTGESNDGVLGF